jgi:phage virion morphogenesis protein
MGAVSFKVRGDFSRLQQMIGRVKGAERGALVEKIAKDVAHELHMIVHESFARSTSPEGEAWKPVGRTERIGRRRRRGAPRRALIKTGRLRKSFRISTNKRGVAIRTSRRGAASHQLGATIREHRNGPFKIPARPFLPSGEPGKPSTKRLEAAAMRGFFGLFGLR